MAKQEAQQNKEMVKVGGLQESKIRAFLVDSGACPGVTTLVVCFVDCSQTRVRCMLHRRRSNPRAREH